ncbi:MAG: S-layer homology domain-containing protein, partial [Pseudoflavonifractor sp.]
MNFKRILAGLLVTATLCGLGISPASAAGKASGFADISDRATAEAAETLRLLGVVAGTGNGNFNPGGTLTRGEFCKMSVMILGKGDEAAAQENRTIFNDVRGDNWARGYINLAASTSLGSSTGSDGKPTGGDKLMMGRGDGNFYPLDKTTYAEAVTIMMRMLGYTATDIPSGATWYDGYLATANAIGLTDGVKLSSGSDITRGQTAILFENLLYLKPRGKTDPYLTATLGGKLSPEAIILDLNATTDDGVTGAISVTDGTVATTYKTSHVPFDQSLAGCRAKLALDKNSHVISIQPSTKGTSRTVSLTAGPEAIYIITAGERIEVASDTPVYRNGVKKLYKEVYANLKAGTQLTLHYAATGKLEYIFVPTVDASQAAAVAKATGGNPFAGLVGSDSNYRVVKNGLPATLADVRQYDVGTYDKTTKTLFVSDLRLTGVYENVKPSPVTPLEVTVLGAPLPVLSSAYADLANFKIGATITLLLTADGQVAGAVAPSEAKSTTVGVADIKGITATVTPLADLRDAAGAPIKLTGELNLSANSAAKLQGQLVTVSSSKVGQMNLSRLTSSGATGSLDVVNRSLGGAALTDHVALFDRVGNGAPIPITLAQLTRKTVPASQISYVGKDYAGRVDSIVFNDATGDGYTYGLAKAGDPQQGGSGDLSYSNPTITVVSGDKAGPNLISGAGIAENSYVGITASLETIDGTPKLAGWVTLKSVEKIPRAAFELDENPAPGTAPMGTVTTPNMILPVAGNVVCYNKTTKKWFASLSEARAYSDSLTIYYDR